MRVHLLLGLIVGFLMIILSASAVQAQDLIISGNGEGSTNAIDVSLDNTTTVVQENEADVDNDVQAHANSGRNTTSGNTGGGGSITTGDASTSVTVTNILNNNHATVETCCPKSVGTPLPSATPTEAIGGPDDTPTESSTDDTTPTPTVVPQVMGDSDEVSDGEAEAYISQVLGLSAATGVRNVDFRFALGSALIALGRAMIHTSKNIHL